MRTIVHNFDSILNDFNETVRNEHLRIPSLDLLPTSARDLRASGDPSLVPPVPMSVCIAFDEVKQEVVDKLLPTLPLYNTSIKAGFPSPADDFVDSSLDLNHYLVQHPAATFFVRAEGNAMINAGIYDGDLLIIDKSMEAYSGAIIVAVVNGEMMVKRLRVVKGKTYLVSESFTANIIEITADVQFEVWGVVKYVIHKPK
jgi:DNA polymerase V